VKLSISSPEGREMIFDLLWPPDFFGELALLDGEPRSADAVATEPTELLLLARDDFLHFLEERPPVAIQLLATLSRRLRRDTKIMQDTVFLDVPARLARTILKLADTHGEKVAEGTLIKARLSQVDLAGLVGTTRETLNKWLGVYEEQGLLRWNKGHLTVLQLQGLQRRITW